MVPDKLGHHQFSIGLTIIHNEEPQRGLRANGIVHADVCSGLQFDQVCHFRESSHRVACAYSDIDHKVFRKANSELVIHETLLEIMRLTKLSATLMS